MINALYWPGYLKLPQVPLVQRTHTAIGFYAQLTSSGVNVWTKLVPIMLAKDNAAAFVAAGADQDPFLDVWASGYARDTSRGAPWDITGPGVTDDRAAPTPMQVSDGGPRPAPALSMACWPWQTYCQYLTTYDLPPGRPFPRPMKHSRA